MSEATQYVTVVFELSDRFPNPFTTQHPFGTVVALSKEDAIFENDRLREVNAELLAALKAIADYHIPDCPTHFTGDELAWAQRQHGHLRGLARAAIANATGEAK
jgi:hypothetical protein